MLDDRTGTPEQPGDELVGEFIWTRKSNRYGWRSYLGDAPVRAPQVPARLEDFAGLPPHTIAGQFYYTLAFHSLEFPKGPGQIVADISDTLENKLASVRCYASQFPPEKEYIYTRIEAWAHRLGQAAGFEAGELFVSPRPLGTGDLMSVLG